MRRGEKGFTLVELAIVLVIIGIIIGAVVKGQDLIDNSKVKKFVTKSKQWEISMWTYMDRKGYLPGDLDKNGRIDNAGVGDDVQAMITAATFINPPYESTTSNTITLGSYTFEVFFGTDGGADAGKNVMTVCKDAACATTFTQEDLMYIEGLDVAIDGNSDGLNGQVVAVSDDPTTIDDANFFAAWAAAEVVPAAWTAGTTQALVYYFDAKR